MDDWVYEQPFHDEFQIQSQVETQTSLKLSTYAGIANLNIKKRLDLYTILGSSRMQLDHEIFTTRAFAWAVGSTLALIKYHGFFLGGDVKYFETNQKPRYFVVDGLPFNIVGDYRLRYQQMQASIGMAYHRWIFVPYLNGTYIFTRIEPEPALVLVRFPDEDEVVALESKSIVGKKPWGMALGLTLVDAKKASLAVEWRLFNQNAVNVNGEIRF